MRKQVLSVGLLMVVLVNGLFASGALSAIKPRVGRPSSHQLGLRMPIVDENAEAEDARQADLYAQMMSELDEAVANGSMSTEEEHVRLAKLEALYEDYALLRELSDEERHLA